MSRLFGKATHIGFVTPDVQREIARMLKAGIGPFFVLKEIRVASRHRGERKDVTLTAAICYTGGIQCEFIQQHCDTPSVYREFLAHHPQGGLQHTAYECSDLSAALEKASAMSGTTFVPVQEFLDPDGNAFEIYVEPRGDEENPLLLQLCLPSPLSAVYGEIERIAANWDGSDPVRDFFSLMPAELLPPVN